MTNFTSEERKTEILKYASEHSFIEAAAYFNVPISTLRYWSGQITIHVKKDKESILAFMQSNGVTATTKKFNVDKKFLLKLKQEQQFDQAPYSNDEKINILIFAQRNGDLAAELEFGISRSVFLPWKKKLNVIEPKCRRKFTDEEKKAILNQAKEDFDNLPISSRSVIGCLSDAATKNNIQLTQLYAWNRQLKIFSTTRQKIELSESEKIISDADVTEQKKLLDKPDMNSNWFIRIFQKMKNMTR